jgi:ferredoxin-nitrite reductase
MSSKMEIPVQHIAGDPLNDEQRKYLEGYFAGLAAHGVKFGDVEPVPASGKTVSLDDLIFEERVKHELHPLDAYNQILENAANNKAPDKEEIFRFKWNGLFFLTPNKEAFMARLRIPGGLLKTFQLRELAGIARELTSGYVQITTRANLQMRLIQPKDAPEVLRRIQSVGLHTRGAGADNIRNLTANPTAGIDPHELIDVMPFCHELAQIIINDRSFYDLPRKFNVAFDGGGLIGTVEDTNDIGAKAVRIGAPISDPASSVGVQASACFPDKLKLELQHAGSETGAPNALPAGIYFRIALGGATGHKAFARDFGVLVKPAELNKVIVAIVRVYIANGNRTDRKKARLKHLLETWSLEKYLCEAEKILGYKLHRAPAELSPSANSQLPTPIPHTHIGIYPQKQKGLNYIGVAMPVGQITPKQMLRVAEIADLYGSGEIRLTVWQNFIIPNVPDAYVETVKKALRKIGFDTQQSLLRGGLIACTGNSYCKFAQSNTKGHAIEIADYLDKRITLDTPINIHLTGCPNSCAQHYMGDIGLLGVKVRGEDGYHVFIGGGFGANQAVGRQIFAGITANDLKPTLEKMLKGYLRRREAGETFQKFTARNDLNTLQAIFTNEE